MKTKNQRFYRCRLCICTGGVKAKLGEIATDSDYEELFSSFNRLDVVFDVMTIATVLRTPGDDRGEKKGTVQGHVLKRHG